MTAIDYAKVRETMVEQQVRPWDVLDGRVLDVLSQIPREAFVAPAYRGLAYADLAVPLGHGEWMLKPVIEGRMLQALDLTSKDEVLEIGTGSGFITACLGRLSRDVLSLDINRELADAARARLADLGLARNVRVETADALRFQPEQRFDAVCVSGAVAAIPEAFLQWLRPGGRMFVVRGKAPVMAAELVRNTADGFKTQSLFETVLPYLSGAAPTAEFKF